ncbi:arginase family protein [Companilactobacillus nantensis]|uniref:Arginase n=1 Tax=Companilactobacillus nantensis DSM 16982 TaxID=1423774 RepID=A0A0R1WS65_9LACO|nr:arginase family protein [Companilactobacillus nantensis]KRM18699.1 arginase [Companilactobacillus nantensis DSM 16982]GEO63110.1 arginase [Companilactobacillus nantensis]
MSENLRIVLPQWQGGMNQNYRIGSKILEAIVPESSQTPTLHIPVSNVAETENDKIDAEKTLLKQMQVTFDTLQLKQPKRVITLGGDCSISEAPFDYLHGQYPDKFGVIWLDAHPDISDPKTSHHIHEMVVANLLHKGAEKFNQQVKNPIQPNQVLMAGLQYEQLRTMDQKVKDLNLSYVTPSKLVNNSDKVIEWLKVNEIKHIAIHLDLDVLDPDDFRSILPAEPGMDRSQFGAAIGTMKLEAVIRLLQDIGSVSDLVGLSLAEHMPWDAINLHNGLAKLSIFK